MNDSLALDAWVLLGNALHLLLQGIPADALQPAARERLLALDERLRSIEPGRLRSVLHDLPESDRRLMASAMHQAFSVAGENASSLLGMDRGQAAPVLALLDDRQRDSNR